MSGRYAKNGPERIEPRGRPSTSPIETHDWEEIADDELSIRGQRQIESEDAGELSEDDDDNPYQNSDDALPDDEEEKEIARDPEREGHRFGD
jgi:hypothetical protein